MEKIELNNKAILVTGAAGFIGSNLVKRLFNDAKGATIVGIDNMNDYYDVSLKEYRLGQLIIENGKWIINGNSWQFVKGDIADRQTVDQLFEQYKFDIVVNLAAQAGVRYSITNPDAYIQSNLIGFYNILEACRHHPVEHLVYASSSSVYGTNKKVPYSTDDKVDNPVSLYAATKKSNELMAHAYSKLYNIPSTGLRFFTVYGPAGRPDMAYFASPTSCAVARRYRFSTMAIVCATSPMLTTSSRALCASCREHPRNGWATTDCLCRRTPSTTSETTNLRIC